MYRVLYRKWRPQVFDDVVGQPHITSTLRAEVREDRLSHAYLFTGSRGTGKTTCAKILAKAVNCLSPVNGNPCNKCAVCRGIDDGTVLDVTEMDAASNRGIDDIRALRDEVSFTPSTAKYRVYIVDEVHMLSPDASNALLKTLEEPPAHVIFILATTEINKILPTILSRCQRFDFRRIEPGVIADRLTYVATEEGTVLDRDAAMLIARLSDGGMRDALSLLDACISVNEHVTNETVFSCAGLVGREQIFSLVEAIGRADASDALRLLDDLHNASCDTGRLLNELTDRFRSFLILKTVRQPQNLIVSTEEEFGRLQALSDLFTKEQVLYALQILTDTASAARASQNRRVEAEMAVIRLCSPENDNTTAALSARIAKLEAAVAALSAGKPVAIPTAAQTPAPAAQPAASPVPVQKQEPSPAPAPPAPAASDFAGFGEESGTTDFSALFASDTEDDAPIDEAELETLFSQDKPDAPDEGAALPFGPDESADEDEPLPFGEDHAAPAGPDPSFDVDKFVERYSGKTVAEVERQDAEIAKELSGALPFRTWSQIVLAIEREHSEMVGRFTDSVAYIRGDKLIIRVTSPMIRLMTPPELLDQFVAPAVQNALGKAYRIEFEA